MTVSASDGGGGRPEKWLSSEQALKLAWGHLHAGRLADAERIARELAKLRRIPIDALQILGLVCYRTGRAAEAVQHLERAVKGVPGNASLHANLAEYRRVSGDLPGAVQAARRAVEIDPKHPQGLNNLGVALLERGRHAEAEPHFRALLALKPDHAEAWNNLGNLLSAQSRFADAAAAYDRAVALRPAYPEALGNAAQMERRQGRLVQAEGLFRRAIAVHPQHAAAHLALGRLRLLAGDGAEGWRESEWRLALAGVRPPDLPGRPWDGGAVEGRRILVHAEADVGETVLFARFLPVLAARGPARLSLLVAPSLRRLMQAAFPDLAVVAHAPADTELTVAIGSLPLLLGLGDRAVPTDGAPWLAPPADRLDAWRARLGPGDRPRVGIAWTTGRRGLVPDEEPVPAAALVRALAGRGRAVVALQTPPAGEPAVEDVSSRLGDLADTAAVLGVVDGVVTADNAVAHLAGALGRPTVLLLARPDWPWGGAAAAPWYRTVATALRGEGETPDDFAARAAAMLQ